MLLFLQQIYYLVAKLCTTAAVTVTSYKYAGWLHKINFKISVYVKNREEGAPRVKIAGNNLEDGFWGRALYWMITEANITHPFQRALLFSKYLLRNE